MGGRSRPDDGLAARSRAAASTLTPSVGTRGLISPKIVRGRSIGRIRWDKTSGNLPSPAVSLRCWQFPAAVSLEGAGGILRNRAREPRRRGGYPSKSRPRASQARRDPSKSRSRALAGAAESLRNRAREPRNPAGSFEIAPASCSKTRWGPSEARRGASAQRSPVRGTRARASERRVLGVLPREP